MKNKNKKSEFHTKYGLLSNIKYIFKQIKKYSPKLFLLMLSGFIFSPVINYLWSYVTKLIIDLITNNTDMNTFFIIIGCASGAMLLSLLLQNLFNSKKSVYSDIVRINMNIKQNEHIMKIDYECLENPTVLDMIQKSQNAVKNSYDGIEGLIEKILEAINMISVLIVGFIILGKINIYFSFLMIGIAIINFLISNWGNKWGKTHIWDVLAPWWRKRAYMNWTLSDFSFAKDIRMFNLKDWLTQKFKELNKERYAMQKKNARLWFGISMCSVLLWCISQAFIYAYLVYLIYNHQITIGNFTLYLSSIAMFFGYVSMFMNLLSELFSKSREVDDFRSFMDYKKESDIVSTDTQSLSKLGEYNFEFKNVSFKYPRSEKYALKNVNITIKSGEKLAVVGLNGAGKSTFIKILLRLYEPTEGEILLNGKNIASYNKNDYFKIFSPVFQDIQLFALPLRNNISMKFNNTDNSLVEKCLSEAGISDKIHTLSKGIDTPVLKVLEDDGVDFSGGEKQKIALARSLYKKGAVVVLDEPTAALDALAESQLYSNFDKLIGKKTAVYISHRLGSTKFCDNIAMFEDGQIVEYGTHAQLLNQNGKYANMFDIQAQYYVEKESENE